MDAKSVEAILETFLTLALQATSSKQVQAIITALIAILPWAIKEAQDLVQPIRNIITVLQNNGSVTDQQMQALQALDADADQGFEDAVTAYLKNHPSTAVGVQTVDPTSAAG